MAIKLKIDVKNWIDRLRNKLECKYLNRKKESNMILYTKGFMGKYQINNNNNIG